MFQQQHTVAINHLDALKLLLGRLVCHGPVVGDWFFKRLITFPNNRSRYLFSISLQLCFHLCWILPAAVSVLLALSHEFNANDCCGFHDLLFFHIENIKRVVSSLDLITASAGVTHTELKHEVYCQCSFVSYSHPGFSTKQAPYHLHWCQ